MFRKPEVPARVPQRLLARDRSSLDRPGRTGPAARSAVVYFDVGDHRGLHRRAEHLARPRTPASSAPRPSAVAGDRPRAARGGHDRAERHHARSAGHRHGATTPSAVRDEPVGARAGRRAASRRPGTRPCRGSSGSRSRARTSAASGSPVTCLHELAQEQVVRVRVVQTRARASGGSSGRTARSARAVQVASLSACRAPGRSSR